METLDEIFSKLCRKKTCARHYPFKKATAYTDTDGRGGIMVAKPVDMIRMRLNRIRNRSGLLGTSVANLASGDIPGWQFYWKKGGESGETTPDVREAKRDANGNPIRVDMARTDPDGHIRVTITNRRSGWQKDVVALTTEDERKMLAEAALKGKDEQAAVKKQIDEAVAKRVSKARAGVAAAFLAQFKAEQEIEKQLDQATEYFLKKIPLDQWKVDPLIMDAIKAKDISFHIESGKFYPTFGDREGFIAGLADELMYRSEMEEKNLPYDPPDVRALARDNDLHETAMYYWSRTKDEGNKERFKGMDPAKFKEMQEQYQKKIKEGSDIAERLYTNTTDFEQWAKPIMDYKQLHDYWINAGRKKYEDALKALENASEDADIQKFQEIVKIREKPLKNFKLIQAELRDFSNMIMGGEFGEDTSLNNIFTVDKDIDPMWLDAARSVESEMDKAENALDEYIQKQVPEYDFKVKNFEGNPYTLYPKRARVALGKPHGSTPNDSPGSRYRGIGIDPLTSEQSYETPEARQHAIDDIVADFGPEWDDAESAIDRYLFNQEQSALKFANKENREFGIPIMGEDGDAGLYRPLTSQEREDMHKFDKRVVLTPIKRVIVNRADVPKLESKYGKENVLDITDLSDKESATAIETYRANHVRGVPMSMYYSGSSNGIELKSKSAEFNPANLAMDMDLYEERAINMPKTKKQTQVAPEKREELDEDSGHYKEENIESTYIFKKVPTKNGSAVVIPIEDPTEPIYVLIGDKRYSIDPNPKDPKWKDSVLKRIKAQNPNVPVRDVTSEIYVKEHHNMDGPYNAALAEMNYLINNKGKTAAQFYAEHGVKPWRTGDIKRASPNVETKGGRMFTGELAHKRIPEEIPQKPSLENPYIEPAPGRKAYMDKVYDFVDKLHGVKGNLIAGQDFVQDISTKPEFRRFFNPKGPEYNNENTRAFRHALYSFHPEFSEDNPLALDQSYIFTPAVKEIPRDQDIYRDALVDLDKYMHTRYHRYLIRTFGAKRMKEHPELADKFPFEWYMTTKFANDAIHPGGMYPVKWIANAYNLNNPFNTVNINSEEGIKNRAIRTYIRAFDPKEVIGRKSIVASDDQWAKQNKDLIPKIRHPKEMWLMSPQEKKARYDAAYPKFLDSITDDIEDFLEDEPDLTLDDFMEQFRSTKAGQNYLLAGNLTYYDSPEGEAYRKALEDALYNQYQTHVSVDDKQRQQELNELEEETQGWADRWERTQKIAEDPEHNPYAGRTPVSSYEGWHEYADDATHENVQDLARMMNNPEELSKIQNEPTEEDRKIARQKEKEESEKRYMEHDFSPWTDADAEEKDQEESFARDNINDMMFNIDNRIPQDYEESNLETKINYILRHAKGAGLFPAWVKTKDEIKRSRRAQALMQAIIKAANEYKPKRKKNEVKPIKNVSQKKSPLIEPEPPVTREEFDNLMRDYDENEVKDILRLSDKMGINTHGGITRTDLNNMISYHNYLKRGDFSEPYAYSKEYEQNLAGKMNLKQQSEKPLSDWTKEDTGRVERVNRLYEDVVRPTADMPITEPTKAYSDLVEAQNGALNWNQTFDYASMPKEPEKDFMEYTPQEMEHMRQTGLYDTGAKAPEYTPATLADEPEPEPEEEIKPVNATQDTWNYAQTWLDNSKMTDKEVEKFLEKPKESEEIPQPESPALSDPGQTIMDDYLTSNGDDTSMTDAEINTEQPEVAPEEKILEPTKKSSDKPEMMSLRDMFDVISKSDTKEGHPYGKPIQGNVFAYGSTFSRMGEDKDVAMPREIPSGKVNGEGATSKKLDL